MGVIYITHRLEELRAIGDRVTILRDGAHGSHRHRCVDLDRRTASSSTWWGVRWSPIYEREPCPPGEELLRVEKSFA